MYLTEKFARLVVNASYADLPSRAVEKAKECILDCVGVAIAGSAEPVRGPLQYYLNVIGGPEEATIVGLGRKTAITNAALVNGVFGHVLDYDDNLKAHPVCASGVGAVEGMLSLMSTHGFGVKDVAMIKCGVRPHSSLQKGLPTTRSRATSLPGSSMSAQSAVASPSRTRRGQSRFFWVSSVCRPWKS